MTAQELMKYQLDDAGYQIEQVVSGFPEAGLDRHYENVVFTPRETLVHLCESYVALVKIFAGELFEVGSYRVSDCSTQGILAEFRQLRATAVQEVLGGDDEALRRGNTFIVGHDYYHVGQLCACRLAIDPDWDAYSIYR